MTLSTFLPLYLPSLEYFWNLVQCDHVILTDHFPFSPKYGLTNSPSLLHAEQQVSLPLQHEHKPLPIYQRRISQASPWAKKHFQTIHHLLHSEPYAYLYLPLIRDMIETQEHNLSRFLRSNLNQLLSLLHFHPQIHLSSTLYHSTANHECIDRWFRDLQVQSYLYSPLVFKRGWLDREVLKARKINLRKFVPFPREHIFHSNRHHSILVFLVQFGPEAGYLIRQYMGR